RPRHARNRRPKRAHRADRAVDRAVELPPSRLNSPKRPVRRAVKLLEIAASPLHVPLERAGFEFEVCDQRAYRRHPRKSSQKLFFTRLWLRTAGTGVRPLGCQLSDRPRKRSPAGKPIKTRPAPHAARTE